MKKVKPLTKLGATLLPFALEKTIDDRINRDQFLKGRIKKDELKIKITRNPRQGPSSDVKVVYHPTKPKVILFVNFIGPKGWKFNLALTHALYEIPSIKKAVRDRAPIYERLSPWKSKLDENEFHALLCQFDKTIRKTGIDSSMMKYKFHSIEPFYKLYFDAFKKHYKKLLESGKDPSFEYSYGIPMVGRYTAFLIAGNSIKDRVESERARIAGNRLKKKFERIYEKTSNPLVTRTLTRLGESMSETRYDEDLYPETTDYIELGNGMFKDYLVLKESLNIRDSPGIKFLARENRRMVLEFLNASREIGYLA